MRGWKYYISSLIVALLAFIGCDVHEFPTDSQELVPLHIHLKFDTEMPLYKTINYTRSKEIFSEEEKKTDGSYDVRYIIKAFRTDNIVGQNRTADTTFVFTKSDISNLNHSVTIELNEGSYDLRVWADYVDAGSDKDKFYNTSDFSEIILTSEDVHVGSNDYRDAFEGEISIEVESGANNSGSTITIVNEATIAMSRPMGKFKFIATDGEEFVRRMAELFNEQGILSVDSNNMSYEQLLQNIDISQFKVVFRYNNFMPCSFNMFTDKAADAWTRVNFSSQMYSEQTKELTLGYDYIFVGNNETELSISVDVYDNEGELLCSSRPIKVSIARSKLTIVKGELLSPQSSTGGAFIDPGYDGDDYNIQI